MGPPGENGLEGLKVSKTIILAVYQPTNVLKYQTQQDEESIAMQAGFTKAQHCYELEC